MSKIDFNIDDKDGCVRLSERGMQDENGYWTTNAMIDDVPTKVSLAISQNMGHNAEIELTAYHVQANTDGADRHYHLALSLHLTPQMISHLHRFLGIMIVLAFVIVSASPAFAAHKKHRSNSKDREHYEFIICQDNPRRCLVLTDE
jgi:hypothetical protein